MILATSNSGKIKEFQSLLEGHFIEAPPRVLPLLETANTYYENCLMKALRYYEAYRKPVIADDSGLEIVMLEGKPGVHTAEFGGEATPWEDRWAFLYSQLRAFPKRLWQAQFRCVLCYFDGKKAPVFFESVVLGEIAEIPKGNEGFGYDPIFYYPPSKKTFGELSREEKNELSHRAKAIKFLKAYLDHNRATG